MTVESVGYRSRDVTDQGLIDEFLAVSRIGVIGIRDSEFPYAVPVNFVWHNGAVYFHGMGSGKKVRLLAGDPAVCFTVFREDATVPDPVPCHADTAYFSVMLFGEAHLVTDSGEAAQALQEIITKYLPWHYKQSIGPTLVERYRSGLDGNAVKVYRITPRHVTAKQNELPAGVDA